ncbi:MAG: hypothetical protein QXG00_08810 [Candidatus Woesearchaeota archaeon]
MKLDFFKSKKSLEKSNIEIISVHVPKTAGSTFIGKSLKGINIEICS